MPPDYTVTQVFDLFFKIQKVFGLKFETNIARMMKFCEFFMYENATTKDFRQVTGVKTLWNQLFPAPSDTQSDALNNNQTDAQSDTRNK